MQIGKINILNINFRIYLHTINEFKKLLKSAATRM